MIGWAVWLRTIPCLCLGSVLITSQPAAAKAPEPDSAVARQEAQRLDRLPPVTPHGKARVDHSGRKEKGHASWYGPGFAHKRMADGNRMNPKSNVAASKTLPLGSTARVINLKTGKEATVKVEDRGPFVDGRVMDVSPKVANELGMKHVGVAPVVVKPITVPQPNGDVKLERKRNLLIMDNASWHKAKRLAWGNFEPIYLPAYSPNLNPIERLWLILKAEWFCDFVARDKQALMERLDQALNWVTDRAADNQRTCALKV